MVYALFPDNDGLLLIGRTTHLRQLYIRVFVLLLHRHRLCRRSFTNAMVKQTLVLLFRVKRHCYKNKVANHLPNPLLLTVVMSREYARSV